MKRSHFALVSAALLFLATLILFSRTSYASRPVQEDVPSSPEPAAMASWPTFGYQGYLTNSAGNPINNGALPITFRLYTTLTGGSACWSESQSVNVQNGQFNVMLAQITPMQASCLTGTNYLELVVNGEVLSPRELIGTVPYAFNAATLPPNTGVGGGLRIDGDFYAGASGEEFYFHTRHSNNSDFLQITSRDGGGDWKWGQGITLNDATGNVGIGTTSPQTRLDVSGNATVRGDLGVNTVNYSGSNVVIAQSPAAMRMVSNGTSLRLFLDADNNDEGANFQIYRDAPNFSGAVLQTFDVDQNGAISWPQTTGGINDDLVVNGRTSFYGDTVVEQGWLYVKDTIASPNTRDLTIDAGWTSVNRITLKENVTVTGSLSVGSCTLNASAKTDGEPETTCQAGSITSGAYVEANLMTPEERAAETIERFEQGDLLCWSGDDQQLEKCATANDPLVMGVADANGKPIVLGAEQIKVVGPVQAGDYLVASDTPSYAQASDNPSFGIVIGQALEDFDGESGLILAMIRKM